MKLLYNFFVYRHKRNKHDNYIINKDRRKTKKIHIYVHIVAMHLNIYNLEQNMNKNANLIILLKIIEK